MSPAGVYSLRSLISSIVPAAVRPGPALVPRPPLMPRQERIPAAGEPVRIALQPPRDQTEALAHQALRFATPRDPQLITLGRQIQRSLDTEPFLQGSVAQEAFGYPSSASSNNLEQMVQLYLSRELTLPRFETLLFALIQTLPEQTRRLTYVENGPGGMFFSALLLAEFGHEVIIKEPERACQRVWSQAMEAWFPQKLAGRMRLLRTIEEIEEPSPAEIVFWPHPNPYMMTGAGFRPKITTSDDPTYYLGRDVKPGGFLVLQTDSSAYQELQFPRDEWEVVYDTPDRVGSWPSDFVLPTEYYNFPAALRVFRRRQ